MLTFATFHVQVPGETAQSIRAVNGSFDPVSPPAMIRLMARSVRRVYPDARVVVLTDDATELQLTEVELHRDSQVDAGALMLSRMQAQSRCLSRATGDVVLLDADMLLAERIDEVFDEDHDIAFTEREHEMPINGGAMFVPASGSERAAGLLAEAARLMEAGPPAQQQWWGDQAALWSIVSPVADLARQLGTCVCGARVRLLPCDLYNFSTEHNDMIGPFEGKRLLHFKGPRKLHMPHYANSFLHLEEPSHV
jgi:hypothetical protein